MRRRPPGSTRTDTLFPYTTLFRSAAKILFAVRWGGANMSVAAAADGAIAGDTKRAEAVDFAIFGLEHRHRIAEQVRRDRRRAIGRELEVIGDGELDTVGPVVTDVGGQEAAVGTVADRMRSEESRAGKECVSPCSSRWSPFH